MYTDEQLLKLEAEDFLLANPKLYRVIYNQALEDFANALIDGEQNEEFVYNIKEIIMRLKK